MHFPFSHIWIDVRIAALRSLRSALRSVLHSALRSVLRSALRSKKFWWYYYVSMVSAATLLSIFLLRLPEEAPHVYFLNVGQGDAVLIRTPSYHTVLVDGGPGSSVLEKLGEVLPFFEKRIDLVVLTHPHADHLMGLLAVLERYHVRAVLFTAVSYDSELYREFLRRVRKIPVYVARSDQDFLIEDTFLDILYPFSSIAGREFTNINNSSIVMKVIFGTSGKYTSYCNFVTKPRFSEVTCGENAVLLTGDAEVEVESLLLAREVDVSADIMKSGHHGSRTSNSLKFLQMVDPSTIVIQSGEGNQFGHPHPEMLERASAVGAKILRNDIEGRIEIVF